MKTAKKESDKSVKEEGQQAFISLAGADGKVDAYELQNILNNVFMKCMNFDLSYPFIVADCMQLSSLKFNTYRNQHKANY